jgi:hypothetical protein
MKVSLLVRWLSNIAAGQAAGSEKRAVAAILSGFRGAYGGPNTKR